MEKSHWLFAFVVLLGCPDNFTSPQDSTEVANDAEWDAVDHVDMEHVDETSDLPSTPDLSSNADPDVQVDMREPCESNLNPNDFDRWECDPLCQTGCSPGQNCAYGSNPTVGDVTTCTGSNPDKTQDDRCGEDQTLESIQCAVGHNCNGTYCAKFCGDNSECDEGYDCLITGLIGRCQVQCEPFPAENECPHNTQCIYLRDDDLNLCLPFYYFQSREGQPCQSFSYCSQNEFCSGGVCRKMCVDGDDCRSSESCRYFSFIDQRACVPN